MVGKSFMYRGDKIGDQPRFRDVAETSFGKAFTHKCRVLTDPSDT